jgi:hypothetical protein
MEMSSFERLFMRNLMLWGKSSEVGTILSIDHIAKIPNDSFSFDVWTHSKATMNLFVFMMFEAPFGRISEELPRKVLQEIGGVVELLVGRPRRHGLERTSFEHCYHTCYLLPQMFPRRLQSTTTSNQLR